MIASIKDKHNWIFELCEHDFIKKKNVTIRKQEIYRNIGINNKNENCFSVIRWLWEKIKGLLFKIKWLDIKKKQLTAYK